MIRPVMTRSIRTTLDHSDTIYIAELDETYHSTYGALAESMHVYIGQGFHEAIKSKGQLHIFEMGFGTGLNALLTLIEAEQKKIPCIYHAIEAFPLDESLVMQLNYEKLVDPAYHETFRMMHHTAWNETLTITPYFSLKKIHVPLLHFSPNTLFDLVYFDAFAPDKQPELWTAEIFTKLYAYMNEGGILVTYSSKGDVKRALKQAGFNLERLTGAAGKRHMLRCTKPVSHIL